MSSSCDLNFSLHSRQSISVMSISVSSSFVISFLLFLCSFRYVPQHIHFPPLSHSFSLICSINLSTDSHFSLQSTHSISITCPINFSIDSNFSLHFIHSMVFSWVTLLSSFLPVLLVILRYFFL